MTSALITEQSANRRSLVLIILIGLIAYSNSFSGVFLFDDGYTIVYNEKVNDITFERLKLGRPLIGFVNAINHLIDGGNPRGYHLVNLVEHLLGSLFLFGLVRRTLLLDRWSERVRNASRPLALVIATIWMVHPLQTASVTYIIQRCESMMGMFYLITMYCFLRGATSSKSTRWYIASIAAGLLGNACKEVMVTVPFVILVYDWVFLAPRPWQLLKKRGWYYLLLTTLIVLCFLHWAGKLVVAGTSKVALGFDYPHFGPWEYLLTQTHVILHYVRLSFWPDLLCFDYQDWTVIKSWRDCWLQGSILCVTVLYSLIACALRSWVGFAIFAFFAILAPTSSVMPIQDLIFDHRMYLSLAPLVCLTVGFGWYVGTFCVDRGLVTARIMSAIGALIATTIIIALTATTMIRNHDYRSVLAIWSDTIKKRPNCVRAITEVVGKIYQEDTVDEARRLAKHAIDQYGNYHSARHYYGIILFDNGELDAAANEFEYASRLHTEYALYPRLEGLCYLATGRYTAAADAFRKSIERAPNDSWSKALLGLAELENGNDEVSAAIFAELREAKDSVWVDAFNEARTNAYRDHPMPFQKRLAILYAKAGVLATGEKKLELLDILAVAYANSGQFDEAQTAVKKAIALAEEKKDEKAIRILNYRLDRYRQHKTLRFGEST